MDTSLATTALAAVLILYIPGLLVLLIAGLRHRYLVGYAPVFTLAVLEFLSLLYPIAGIHWTLKTVLVGIAIVSVGCVFFRLLIRRWRSAFPPDKLTISQWLVTTVGVALALLIVVLAARKDFGFIYEVNNSFDSMFHYSAVRYIRETGDSWPTHLFVQVAGKGPGFYPLLFNLIAAIIPGNVIVATNVVAYTCFLVFATATASLLWAAITKYRGILPAIAIAIVLPSLYLFVSFIAMVWLYGLWPNVLQTAVYPILLALGYKLFVEISQIWRESKYSVSYISVLVFEAIVALVGAAGAHPSAVFAAFWIVWCALIVLAWWAWSRRRKLFWWLFAISALGLFSYLVVIWRFMGLMALTAKSHFGIWGFFRQLLADQLRITIYQSYLPYYLPLWIFAIASIVYLLRARVFVAKYWVFYFFINLVLTGISFLNIPVLSMLVSPWYQARERLMPMLSASILVVTTLGLIQLLRYSIAVRQKRLRMLCSRQIPGVLVLIASLLATGSLLVGPVVNALDTKRLPYLYSVATRYTPYMGEYITPRERQFITSVSKKLPKDALIIGLPADGLPYFYSLTGRHVLFYSSSFPRSQVQYDIANFGDAALQDPLVRRQLCALGQPIYLYVDRSGQSGINVIGSRQLAIFDAVWRMTFDPGKVAFSSPGGEYRLYDMNIKCGQ